jgi:Septum formation
VNERWVCKRCFADNNDADAACVRCGLTRGSEATEQDQVAWSAAGGPGAAVAVEPPAWRRLLRFWWIPTIAIALLVGYIQSAQRGDDGSLVSAGTVSVDDLQVGDCFNTGDETEIADVDGVPCTEVHEYEVFAVETYDAEALPDDSQLEAVFTSICSQPFESYVNFPYATSAIYANMITPSEESWADGDRTYICVLYDPDDPELTQSMRGAAR